MLNLEANGVWIDFGSKKSMRVLLVVQDALPKEVIDGVKSMDESGKISDNLDK